MWECLNVTAFWGKLIEENVKLGLFTCNGDEVLKFTFEQKIHLIFKSGDIVGIGRTFHGDSSELIIFKL